MKIRHGDTVVVIAGKDKGKTGTVERVLKTEGRVIVSGVNMRTRHVKKTAQQAGRKVVYEASIAINKVMIVDPKTQKPSRVGFTINKDGKKMRISKMSGVEILKAKAQPKKKVTKATEGTKGTEVMKQKSDSSDSSNKKSPFWKRMKFGAEAMDQAEVGEIPNMEKDHSIPSQEIHVRKGARGS
jgi:large subunit ribosomal protein L24